MLWSRPGVARHAPSGGVQGWLPIEGLAEVGLALGTTYGSDDYMSIFFGVRARGSAQSGLPAFDADAGFRDVASRWASWSR